MIRTHMPGEGVFVSNKCVFLIIDGLGDLPVPELNGRTPLEAACTPVLDRLAGAGRYGLVDPTAPGAAPHTHSGCGTLMGLAPEQSDQLKRGPVEAAGAGRVLANGDVAVRANFASVVRQNGELLVTDRRAGRVTRGTDELAASLSGIDLGDGITADMVSTDQHRGVLILKGPGLDASISDTDPGDTGRPAAVKPCRALNSGAEFTADKINVFLYEAHRLLAGHPVNEDLARAGKPLATGVITRGAGLQFEVDNILHARGIRAAVVSGCNTVLGLARLFRFETITDTRFTATVETDIDAKFAAAAAALGDHDLVFVHVKAPDICSHDRHPRAKRDFLQRLDSALERLLASGAIFAVAADHTTDSNTGSHTADPVPGLIFDPRSAGAVEPVKFGESGCRQGTMPRQSSHDFLTRVLDMMAGRPPG